MSSLTNINNNTRVVNVGRTTPVAPGQQPASKSIPVVLATDQTAIPVVEQNKVQSEVSLSLLGIPRSEVALGIFADVNTYDVNPSEWSSSPQYYNSEHGIKHLPNEAGALVEAPRNKKAVLTSKRFFRYQPGRVSAATFGVKCTVSNADFARNPVIRKYGIFDNFDGYYWEAKQSGKGDNFNVVRRTQSLLRFPASPFGLTTDNLRKSPGNSGDTPVPYNQSDDYRAVGKEGKELKGKYFVRDRQIITDNILSIPVTVFNTLVSNDTNGFGTYYNSLTGYAKFKFKEKCHRDVTFALKMALMDMEWGGDAHTRINTKNYQSGIFPSYGGNDAGQFELDLHTAVRSQFTSLGLTATGLTKIQSLYDFLVKVQTSSSNGGDEGFFNRVVANGTSITTAQIAIAYNSILSTATALGTMSYGDKSKLDTLFDTRKHYWSYFVSSFAYNSAGDAENTDGEANTSNTSVYQTYKFSANSINADFYDGASFEAFEGAELTANSSVTPHYPYSNGDTINNGAGQAQSVTDSSAAALNEFYENIKYKCSRDLEYVINGYKNDLIGGGNAETLYNASMYYRGAGLSIYTQADGSGIPDEIAKHKHLRNFIKHDLRDADIVGMGATPQSATIDRVKNELAQLIIDNFSTETQQGVNLGDRGFAGNLVAYRDGLLMIHAGINDPSLLKEVEKIPAMVSDPFDNAQPTIFKIAKGNVTFGQVVRVVSDGSQLSDGNTGITGVDAPEADYGKLYRVSRVYGPIGNEFTLRTINDEDATKHDRDVYAYNGGSLNTNTIHIETVVPFIGDRSFDANFYRKPQSERQEFYADDKTIQSYNGAADSQSYTENTDPFPEGLQWPLRYSSSGQLDDQTARYIGHIDTMVTPLGSDGAALIRKQYDDINFEPEYINWIKNNVKPEFYGVYEYRVPRSRFSHDKLDGKTSKRVYSDLATGPTGIVRPGQPVTDDAGIWQDAVSEYDFDFTKVTMLKIEFSWYGAVGALFLAYVPVGNGEARWVRVHHLRASNQLKIASLGNATLPITYNVWGGGSPDTLGDGETKIFDYDTSASHHIVKYGASYYIDGGDRGTVRLYSHNNNETIPAYGKKWSYNGTVSNKAFVIPGTTNVGGEASPTDVTYFMGAQLKTDDPTDTGIKVVWCDPSSNTVYLSKQPSDAVDPTFIPDRADLVYGLETKDVIYSTVQRNPVRNRVQVYPTKMSSANLGNDPVRLRMKRTPLFQTLAVPSGDLTLGATDYAISATNPALTVVESSAPYLQNGEELYGWFQGVVGDIDEETIFGRLYKEAGSYYFEVLQAFNEAIVLNGGGKFLPDVRFTRNQSNEVIVGSAGVDTRSQIELSDNLTSIEVINNPVVPIPNTGSNIATLYLTPTGTEQVDLDTYFDYNKEYLSYPLTDEAETLYFAVDTDTTANTTASDVAIGLTWEEQ